MNQHAPVPGYGCTAAYLYPWLVSWRKASLPGCPRVRTPKGDGVLLQVFSDRVVVWLTPEVPDSKVSYFPPAQVEPLPIEDGGIPS